ncbi:MAG: 2-phospho-L-lactate guanylyltransferase [Nitrososphaeraceae archaeon]|jgi:2-phospho-L-lactate/phosphoenolpyruvate guanylyltransferase|nr:2-phospho-L-lactate guanylyltransferase [Nitrososphaeraceae archaeon]MDW0141379.1 2-phospho-L-lactate guanylyltransferase [Nitrososphaeraceae archaeon]
MMKTFAIVPVKRFENAKTRLSSMLDTEDRIRLSSLMLEDTLQILSVAPPLTQVIIVSADKRADEIATKHGAKFLPEEKEKGVNSAVALADGYCIEKEAADATIVIPHDLPLLDSIVISKACELAEKESTCIVICPSVRYDGTNMLLRKPPSVIGTFYETDSYNMHVRTAIKLGIPVKPLLSKSLMYDIDTPEDALQLIKEENVAAKSLEFIKSKL